MSNFDIDALLLEVSPGAACGPNLEYDPVFVELEKAVVGKPEVQYGNTVTPAVPPDWKLVRTLCADLLGRSRDLRVLVHLLHAGLVLEGMPAFADGLHAIERMLDARWDSIHPELDADDGMDPTLRINSLALLADRATLLKDLRETTLLDIPGLGPVSLRTLDIANGDQPAPDGGTRLAMATIELAAADVGMPVLARATDDARRALDSAVAIETLLVRQVGSGSALNLDDLIRMLRRGHDFLAARLAARAAAGGSPAPGGGEIAVSVPGAVAASVSGGAAPRSNGEIAGRDDVVCTLDRLIAYYEQHEPSSPVPILLERAKRLVPKRFIDIIEDLAPDGLSQLNIIKGPEAPLREG